MASAAGVTSPIPDDIYTTEDSDDEIQLLPPFGCDHVGQVWRRRLPEYLLRTPRPHKHLTATQHITQTCPRELHRNLPAGVNT